MPLILSGNVASATASTTYTVANSCRFNRSDSAYMYRSNGTPTSQRKLTISTWLKRGTDMTTTDAYHYWMGIQDTGDGDPRMYIGFTDSATIFFGEKNSAGADLWVFYTNRVFRDPSAYYHIVLSLDTTQGTEANRVKLYVNGTQETSFSTSTYPSENLDMDTTGNEINVACIDNNSPSSFFDGYIAEMVYSDGQAYAASDFGEFDEDSPTIWKPKDVSGLTFGDNGFYLDFEASDNLGNDANGGTDFTEVNLAATDQATDTPTNNFATWNPLVPQTITFSEGNTEASASGASWKSCFSTIGFSSGKWYFETKINSSPMKFIQPGILNAEQVLGSEQLFMDSSGGYSYHQDGAKGNNGSSTAGYGNTFTTGDIISVAFDADNGTIWFGKNGTWQNSATEGEIEAGTTTNAAFSGIDTTKQYLFAISLYNACNISANFGSPAIAISSGNADADGYGNFEYAVPSGYFALCTKNLGAYGG